MFGKVWLLVKMIIRVWQVIGVTIWQTLWQTLQANCCLGGKLKFKRWCCQSTLSRCRLALADWRDEGLRKHGEMAGDIKKMKLKKKSEVRMKGECFISNKENKTNSPLRIPSPLSFHCYLDERGAAPAPLAETKWLAGIWCNLHLSVLKAGYCFCGADVGGHGKRHSWLGHTAGNGVCVTHIQGEQCSTQSCRSHNNWWRMFHCLYKHKVVNELCCFTDTFTLFI